MPQFINITDAVITSTNPQEHPEHQNVLSISTAGSNRYLFEFQNPNVLRRWSAAFRISMYERAALQECYTAALIARSRTATNVRRLFSAYHGALGSKGKYSGWVRVRFSRSIKWQKCWAVVSDTPSSWFAGRGQGLHERLMYKFSSKQSLRGEVRFYESRRDPKNKPIAVLGNVFAAYAVYPEKPFLVDSSTMIKVEGSLQIGRGSLSLGGEQFKDAFVLLMPEDMPTGSNNSSPVSSPVIGSSSSGHFSPPSRSRFTTSPSSLFSMGHGHSKGSSSAAFESMLTWLVAFYDAFNLYGRPEKLITESNRIDSMIFGMPTTLEDSYLDVEEVFVTLAEQGSLENNSYSTRDWRFKMKELTMRSLREGKKVFNPAVLLQNTVANVPVIRPPIPPIMRDNIITAAPVRAESAPAVTFSEHNDTIEDANYPLPTAPRQQNRLNFLRRKPSRPDDSHSRSLSEDGVVNTRQAMSRFSLNEDSEEEPELFNAVGRTSYQSSPLRNSEVRPSTADSAESDAEAVHLQVHVDRPTLMKRASSHRRGHSETRMADLYREAEENKGEYYSDEESVGRPRVARRVSSDEMLKAGALGISAAGGRVSRESLENGTQFNRTFDERSSQGDVSRFRLSESSSDRSETPADPLRDTPQMGPNNLHSSPASSMESLPAPKSQSSPQRPRRSLDDRMYNAPAVSPEQSYNAPMYRDQSQPSVLVPVNGQPIPVRREPSPSGPRPLHAQGPRSAPWSAVSAPTSRPDDVMQYNQDILRPRDHRPAPAPNTAKYPPAVYPVQPSAPRQAPFPGMDGRAYQDSRPYHPSAHDAPMRPRGPAYPPARDNRGYPFADDRDPRGPPPQGHKVARRMIPTNQSPAAAAARSAYPPHLPQGSPQPHPRAISPNDRGRGYAPQGPRSLTST